MNTFVQMQGFDPKQEQARTLKHCLLLASRDREYALYAAGEYERKGAGLFDGLKDKVIEAIDKANAKKQAEVA